MHVVVTGASSGIGEALARAYANEPHRLTLVARRTGLLEELASSLPVPTHVVTADLSDLERCCDWVAAAEEANGPVDLLVNNAGVQIVDPVLAVDVERGEHLFRLDLLAPIRLIHHLAPSMVERGSGIIVNITSVAGLVATPGMCHYNAAKHALAAFSECLGTELRKTGVHVLTVYPGPVRTAMEQAARKRLGGGATDLAPTGSSEGLARLVARAVRRRKRRVVYPRLYAGIRYFRVATQWLTDRFAPSLQEEESGPPRDVPDSSRITQ